MLLTRWMLSRWVFAAIAVLAATGCSSDPAEPTAASTTAGPASSTGLPTNATVVVGAETYSFVAECFLPGDGNIDVAGSGFDSAGQPTELLMRRIPARPYVGVRAAGSLLEPALDAELQFEIEAGVVQADRIEFVRDLDLDSGDGTPVGPATITVTCTTYTDGTP